MTLGALGPLASPAAMPDVAGAYLLVIALFRPLSVTLAGRPALRLGAGMYLYAGSARGPGGIRARVARHARPAKRLHWHIDRLTAVGRLTGAIAFPGGDEHAVLRTALELPGTCIPVPGFGASDCRACPAHLVRIHPAAPCPGGAKSQ